MKTYTRKTQDVYPQREQIAGDTNKVAPIKVAKKTRNCADKQTFEGTRGGIFHWDTSHTTGKPYKHYTKQ